MTAVLAQSTVGSNGADAASTGIDGAWMMTVPLYAQVGTLHTLSCSSRTMDGVGSTPVNVAA